MAMETVDANNIEACMFIILLTLGICGYVAVISGYKPMTLLKIALLLAILLGYKYWSVLVDELQLKCVIADKDGQRYCVRDRRKVDKAANLLATVTGKCTEMVTYMQTHHPNDPRVKRLVDGFNPARISETLPTSELTAYSENKGEKIAFCLNRQKGNDDHLIDINTLTFVAMHELAHIMTESIGHKQDFWENFKFLLENAKAAGVYQPIDYKNKPQDYCGMTITDNPYFDLA